MNTFANTGFTNPEQLLETLTSETIDYKELTEFAENLLDEIPELHTNQDDRKFQAITQIILECFKLKRHFSSTKWVSESKLKHELRQGESPIAFTRVNAKGEICSYKIINFDQIDFSKEIEYADEYEVVAPKLKVTKSAQILSSSEEENEEYKKILSLLKNGENVFLTGFAGTGKSYILNKLKERFKKQLTITSTTGIAAVNVKGQTIHSWAGVGLCRNPIARTVEKIKSRKTQLNLIQNCKILAVDEISMLNIEAFEYINEVLKNLRESSEPFGGIQVLFIGDFYQLPPVEKEETLERRYCFDSPVWNELNLQNIVLKKNYRQSEEKFINALAHMRENCLEIDDIELFKSRMIDSDTSEANILHIFSTNEEANRYNNAKFNQIEEPIKIFSAEDGVFRGKNLVTDGFTESESYILEVFSKNCRAEKEIVLKLGARVMLLMNMDFNKGLINGACGVIQKFNDKSIVIKFDNGIEAAIPQNTFEYFYNDRVVAQRIQYPLRLAYGITIHKSQGMTLDKLVVDCARIFERGQAYVAMSRVKTLSGLYLKNFEPAKVFVDSKVAKFYKNLQEVKDVVLCQQSLFDEVEDVGELIGFDEAKLIVLDCIKEFSGQYGKSGFCKILTGSKQIKDNGYNSDVTTSQFLGKLKGWSQKAVGEIIDKLIEEDQVTVKKISFGRPVLCKK